MKEYALIIFLFFENQGRYLNRAITSVSGFQTEKLCEEAGIASIKVEKPNLLRNDHGLKFVCVRTK